MTCINHGVMPIGVWRSTGRGFLAVMTLLCCVTVAAQQSCDGWVTSTTSSIPTGHSFSFTIYSPTPTVPGSITSSGDFTVRLNGVPVQSGNFNPQSTFTTVPVSGGLTQSMGPGTYSLTAHWTYQWSFIFTNGSCTGDESRSVQVTPVAPTASCHDLTVWLNANGEAVIPIAAVGAGSRYGNNTPADPGSFTLDVPTVDCGDVGPPITVTLTVTDPSTGLSDTCNAVIEVRDSYAPTRAYCPSPDPVSVDPGGCTGVINYSPPTWDDHCDGMGLTGTLGAGPAPGDSRPVGTYNVSWYFMDSSGLSGPACHFTVVVEDHEPPTLDPCPTNIEVRATLPSCAQVVTWTPPSITDNCPGAVLSSTHQPGDHFFDGTTTVVYTATDVGGNVVSCSFDVTVMADFEPPARYDVLPPAMLGQASGPRQLVLADMGRQAFDHALDGHLDLVVLNRDRAELSVLYNDGTGHFGDIELVALALGGFAPTGLATGDFDGVGGLDLVVSLRDAAAVEVVFHDGTGFVPGPQISLTGSRPAGIVVGDLDGDGRSDDLAVALRGFAPGVGDGVSLVFDVAPGFMGTAQALPKTSGLPFRSPENLALCERRVGSDTVMDLVVTDQADTTGYQNV
ncbi:MAG: HYR domain-containing protein, partial [Planctomycetes bacterium]|nr:HYR domain-containing protein [Planctomycetota bacterium]